MYDADVGRWMVRDPIGYLDGLSLYTYVQALAIVAADPLGLFGLDSPPNLPCAGGCGIPIMPPPTGDPNPSPPLCAGGTCSMPRVPDPEPGDQGPPYCAGGACTVPVPEQPAYPGLCDGSWPTWLPSGPSPSTPTIIIAPPAPTVPPAAPGGPSTGGGPSWSGCFKNCMNDYYGGTSWTVCAAALGVDFLIGKTPKTERELRMPHKGKDYVTRFRRWAVNNRLPGPIRRAAKLLYTGTVGKLVAAASCGYAAGVSASCAAICAADESSF